MDTKHTPGPWQSSGTAVYAENGREILFGAHNTRSGDADERRANARLIAASPDLLAAARWMLALIDGGEPMPKPGDEVTEALAAAIAAAGVDR
jgi:hypothetical protein